MFFHSHFPIFSIHRGRLMIQLGFLLCRVLFSSYKIPIKHCCERGYSPIFRHCLAGCVRFTLMCSFVVVKSRRETGKIQIFSIDLLSENIFETNIPENMVNEFHFHVYSTIVLPFSYSKNRLTAQGRYLRHSKQCRILSLLTSFIFKFHIQELRFLN